MSLTNEDKAWIASRLDATNDRLTAAEEHLTRYILELRSEVSRRIEAVEQRLDFFGTTLPSIPPLNKAMIDLGSLMGQLTRAQQRSTDRDFDLETRVLKLEEKLSKLNVAA